jgi:hypothetical protein
MDSFSSKKFYVIIKVVFPIFAFILLTILLRPILLDETPLLRWDQPMWASFTHVMKHEVISDQKWFWNTVTDRENAGLEMGQAYSLNIILLWLLSHIFTPATSVKVLLLISLASLTISLYLISVQLTNPLFAIIPALLCIPIILPLAASGMAYSHLSLSFALFFWLSSLKMLKRFRSKDWLISVLLVTIAIYAHPMGFIACMVIWFTLLFCFVTNKYQKSLRKVTVLYFIIPLISLMLASPHTFNIFFSGSQKKTLQPKQQQARSIKDIQNSIFLSQFGHELKPNLDRSLNLNLYLKHFGLKGKLFIFLFAMTGLVAVVKKENSLKLPLIALYISAFILASRLLLLSPIQPGLFTTLTIYYWRFALWMNLVFILLAGIGLQFWYDFVLNNNSEKKLIHLSAKFFAIFLLIMAFILCARSFKYTQIWSEKNQITLEKFEKKEEILSLWSWLSKNVNPEETRVYFEDTALSYPLNSKMKIHALALTSIATDIKQIGGWSGFASGFGRRYNIGRGGVLFGRKSANEISEKLIADNLKLLNCKYIVVHSKELVNRLENISILQEAAIIGNFHIFEYSDMISAWAYKVESQEPSTLIKRSSTHYILKSNGNKNDKVQISLAYNNKWRAYYKNTEIPILYHKALMQIRLPETGSQVVELKFVINKKTPIIILLLGLACLLCCIRFVK